MRMDAAPRQRKVNAKRASGSSIWERGSGNRVELPPIDQYKQKRTTVMETLEPYSEGNQAQNMQTIYDADDSEVNVQSLSQD